MKPRFVWMRPVLGILICLGFLGLTGYLTSQIFTIGFSNVAKEILVIWGMCTQALILMVKDGFGFYFGTSQGSAHKAETIDRALNGTITPAPEPSE